MKKLIAGIWIVCLALAGCEGRRELHIYGWPDYISPAVIANFEKEHGCTVHVDTFDSNETMYANLKKGAKRYDLINPSSYHVDELVRDGLIVELDHSRLPNVFENFDKSCIDLILDKEFKYSVPYAESYTGLCYLKDRVPFHITIDSWNVLENPAFSGKTTLLDDIREVMCAGLLACGYSLNSVDPKEIAEAVKKIQGWVKYARKIDAEAYKFEVPSGTTWVAHGYSFDSKQVIHGDPVEGLAARPDVGFALPKEGFPITFDVLVIPRAARRPDLAYEFINFLYEPRNALVNMKYVFGPMAVKPALDMLSDDIKSLIVLDEETLKRGQVIQPISVHPGAVELYDKAWKTIKAMK